MKLALIIGSAIAIVAMIFFINNKPDNTDIKGSNRFAAIEQDIQTGAQLIDVRTPEEFTESHIEDAINLPLQAIEAGELPKSDKDEVLYLYCRSGNRSAQAASILRNQGYTNIKDLGGMNSVAAMGGKVVECC